MNDNPLHAALTAQDPITPEGFAALLEQYPPDAPGDYGLIPIERLGLGPRALESADGFILHTTDLMPGVGFYMIESENGAPSHRFAGGAAYSQIVLPIASERPLRVRLGLKHVFDPACAEGALAFVNGARVTCSRQGDALIIEAPSGALIADHAAVLTIVPAGHVEIEGGARRVAFGVTQIAVSQTDPAREAASLAAASLLATPQQAEAIPPVWARITGGHD